MKAIVYEKFRGPLTLRSVSSPTPEPDGVVIKVEATGLCRSDWHGWMGHDPDIILPHVPGHEFAGTVVEVGKMIQNWKPGERVTMPFVCGCGHCEPCLSGNQQVCDHQFQPGFTAWGSFAEYVAVKYADINLVKLPEEIDMVTAASLGCRFITSFRGIVDQAKVRGGEWVAVHGCGGVGLSAIMIASALGANVIGIDIADDKLDFAVSMGATTTINAKKIKDVSGTIKEITKGGAHVSVDALGSNETCFNSISGLRKRGKHIQIGLMVADYKNPKIPMNQVIANELEIIGSHGMQAYKYPAVFEMIRSGKLHPEKLIGKKISLKEVPESITNMNKFPGVGVTIVNNF